MDRNNRTPSRLVDYSPISADMKIGAFIAKKRLEVRDIYISIKNGTANNPRKSENFAKKTTEFIEYIEEHRINEKSSVRELNKKVQIQAALLKEAIRMLDAMIETKLTSKVVIGELYAPFSDITLTRFATHMTNLYKFDLDYLVIEKQKAEAELVLINLLIGLLADKSFMESLGAKNSWSVETLREELVVLADEQYLDKEDKRKIGQILTLPYMKSRKYLKLSVAEVKEIIAVRKAILEKTIDWIDSVTKYLKDDKKLFARSKLPSEKKNIYTLLEQYERSINHFSERKERMEREYRLLRFGQGLLHSDVNGPLFI